MTSQGFANVTKLNKAGDTATGTIVFTGTPPVQIPAGAATGDVLTSDGSGNATWQVPAATAAMALLASLASPALTGTPTAPTQAPGDNSTRIATDAFVTAAVAAGSASALGTATFSTSTVNVNVSAAVTYTVTLTGTPTGGTPSFAITGAAGSGAQTLTLFITQGGAGGYLVHWPTSVTWITGTAPVLASAAGALSIVSLETVNGGTTWYGTQITGAPTLPLSVANGGTGQSLYTPISNEWRATDMGYITQSYDAVSTATASRGVTSGVLWLIGVMVRAAATVTGARVILQQAAAPTLTASQSFLGLYGSASGAGGAGALLGSGNQTSGAVALSTAFAGTTTAQIVVPFTAQGAGTLNLTPGMYWVAILSVFTGNTLSFGGGSNVSGLVANGTLPVSNARFATQGSALTALPATFTPSTNVLAQNTLWAALY